MYNEATVIFVLLLKWPLYKVIQGTSKTHTNALACMNSHTCMHTLASKSSIQYSMSNTLIVIMYCYTNGIFVCQEYSRATENRLFASSDRFLVCKTDSICIKCIFFSVRKNTLCGSYTGPITWISQVSNR